MLRDSLPRSMALCLLGVLALPVLAQIGAAVERPQTRAVKPGAPGASAPTITSDKPDYHPGERVTLTGAGWAPHEVVTIIMTVEPVTHGPVTLMSMSDRFGRFANSDYVVQQADLDVTFYVTATGRRSGLTALTTFTDTGTVTAATGGSAISADTNSTTGNGAFTTLTGPVINETNNTGMPVGTMILNAPAGFEFDTAANSVTVTVTGTGTLAYINTLASTTGQARTKTFTPTTTTITVWVTTASTGTGRSVFTWSGIKVRPTAGSPLANGNITYGGTSTGVAGGANMGTLAEVAGTANKLAFTAQPGGGTGGTAWVTQPVVSVQDQFGNTVTGATNSITLAIGTNPGGGALTCTTNPLSATSGVATFAACRIDKAGTGYTLTASASGLTGATSNSFNITVGPANNLAFTTQPGGGSAGVAWTTQPVVSVQDAGGNTVTGATNSITLAIGTNPAGGTLTCTTNPLNATSGVATFAGCRINNVGTGYTLTASAAGLTGATSNTFNITAGADASHSTISPATAVAATNGTTWITVQARDQFNNNLTTGGASVVMTIASGTGTLSSVTDNGDGTYGATLTSPATAGSATITATLGGTAVGTAVGASSSVVTYVVVPSPPSSATGSYTISYDGNYVVYTFTGSGTFAPTIALDNVEYLVVGGGGSGGGLSGAGTIGGAGGGGAGGMLTGTLSLSAQLYAVTVGAGGTGSTTGANGGNSVFASVTAVGGGYGAYYLGGNNGNAGGSGGGARISGTVGSGTAGQGNNGGSGSTSGGAGGGGGKGGVGVNASGTSAGAGGVGSPSSIGGSSVTYAAGGTGGSYTTASAGANATANTGNGGGGASGSSVLDGSYNGGSGGSGIVDRAV